MGKNHFGETSRGEQVSTYDISNQNGMKVVLTDFGATTVSVFVKDKDGNYQDVVLGYDNAKSYENHWSYFGATVGRYANRISNAKVEIEGQIYELEVNDNENCLHSGSNGVARRVWDVKSYTENEITFVIEDADLAEGFPGNAVMEVTYRVSDDNALVITYNARADKTTAFNMTNHSYFNLNGHKSGYIGGHVLQINASHYTPVSSSKAIPTGEITSVTGTPFDFTEAKTIGRDIEANDEQLGFAHGYDHNYAIDKTSPGLERAATVVGDKTGIAMDVFTDCLGVQFYSANFIGGQAGKEGAVYEDRDAFCLETQYFPNAINEPNFTTPITQAGEEYKSQTVYHFYLS